MGFDLYARIWLRHRNNNRKSAVQQWAVENGCTFQKITPEGRPVYQYVQGVIASD